MIALLRSFFLLLLMPACLVAQSDLRIYEWEAFLPYQVGNTVAQSTNDVYYGSVNGLIKIDKETHETSFFSKVDGLSDVDIRLVSYHVPSKTLIIVYANSGIDLVTNDGITYLDDIRIASSVNGSKVINAVFTDDTDDVYFSCAFGLVQFNLRTRKFGFTTFTPAAVNEFTKYQDTYLMATDAGIYRFSPGSGQLAANFGSWALMGADEGLSESYACRCLAVYDGVLFAGVNDDVFRYNDGFALWDTRAGHYVEFLSGEGSHLMAGFRCANNSCNGKVHFYTLDSLTNEHGYGCTGQPTHAIEDQLGQVWYADEYPGIRVAASVTATCEILSFNTPYSDKVSELAYQDGALYVASGGVSDSYSLLNRRDGFYIYRDDTWSYYNHTNVPLFLDKGVRDYFRILPAPDNTKVYVGSYSSGLIEFDFDSFTLYDPSNSALQIAIGDATTRVGGLAFDEEENLWISNFLAPRPIVVKKADGSWKSFNVPRSTELAQVIIDQRGYKWFAVISVAEGLLVFDDRGTIDDTSDDRYKYFNTSNSALPTNLLATLTMDREGDIWVGTREGPVVFNGAQDPFSGDNQGYRVRVDQDGVLSYLLFEEEVNTIAVDGANRKWLGTHNGIFVQSPDGETQVAYYNTSNSPLLHNNIIDITINQENGDVYIGTDAGINVLRTDAISGRPVHSGNVYAFPNPVRPDYNGPIAITGLAEDAIVKITDIHGSLVFETQALGGQAIWYGKDLSGQKAATGVYLVFSTTQSQFDKPDAIVTKILLVN